MATKNNNETAGYQGEDGMAEITQQKDGTFYILVSGDYDFDSSAKNKNELETKLTGWGYTQHVYGAQLF